MEVEDLPITVYRTLINQSLNIANLIRGGKFELQTSKEKAIHINEEAEMFKLFQEEIKQGNNNG